MSIADHFEQAPDSRFMRDYQAGTARRQLNLSLILVVVVAFASAALGIVVRFDLSTSHVAVASQAANTPPAYAGKL